MAVPPPLSEGPGRTRARLARGVVSRADLLLSAQEQGGEDALERRAVVLGFQRMVPPTTAPRAEPALPSGSRSASATALPEVREQIAAGDEAAVPVPQVALPAITRHQRLAPEAGDAGDAGVRPARVAVDAPDARPWAAANRPARQPLLTAAQLRPALLREVRQTRDAGMDLAAVVRRVSRGGVVRQIPCRQRPVWSGALWVVLDVADHLQPLHDDLCDVFRALHRLRGAAGMVLWVVRGSPDAPQGSPVNVVNGLSGMHRGRWPVPPSGTTVLLLSDLGLLRPGAPGNTRPWTDWVDHLLRAGCLPQAWLPMSAQAVPLPVAQCLPVHCLQAGAGLRRQRGHAIRLPDAAPGVTASGSMALLRALVSCCVWLEPQTLRALRLAHPQLRQQPETEAYYWGHADDVGRSDASRILRPAPAAQARRQLVNLPAALRAELACTLWRQHAHRPRSTLMLELSLWQVHAAANEDDRAAVNALLPPAVRQAVDAAGAWLSQLGAHAASRPDGPAAELQRVQSFAADMLDRQSADGPWQSRMARPLAELWAAAGDDLAPPAHVPASVLVQALLSRKPAQLRARTWLIMQVGNSLQAWDPDAPLPRGASIVETHVAARALVVEDARGRRIVMLDRPRQLAELGADSLPVTFSTDEASWTVEAVRRPAWAAEFGRDARGLFALAATPCGASVKLYRRPGPGDWEPLPAGAPAPQAPVKDESTAPLVVISGAAGDIRWIARLGTHLSPLARMGTLRIWEGMADESRREPGWPALDDALRDASAVIVLVTREYVTSHFVQQVEWPKIVARRKLGNLTVLPIMMEACDWHRLPGLEAFVLINSMGPLESEPDDRVEQGLMQAVQRVQRELRSVVVPRKAAPPRLAGATPAPPLTPFTSAQGAASSLVTGADAQFGLYADLTVRAVTQRLRWIAPGEFDMGPPETEAGRHEDEGPVHRVRISQGFWLADTACTQDFWRAVMGGENPGQSKGSGDPPVAQVSWDDVQAFMVRLKSWLPAGCEPVLPGENQVQLRLDARSAARHANHRGARGGGFGFRLALTASGRGAGTAGAETATARRRTEPGR